MAPVERQDVAAQASSPNAAGPYHERSKRHAQLAPPTESRERRQPGESGATGRPRYAGVTEPLSEESRRTVRQVALLAAQRLVQIAAGALYMALIPRVMGPDTYGRFSTLQSISLWFSMLSGLGAVSMMTRFVPEFLQRDDLPGLRKLCGSLFTLRLGSATAGGLINFVLVPLWLNDLGWLPVALVSATIALRVAAGLPYSLLLGLNLASRWGAAEMLRRVLLFPLTYGGFLAAGLAGACAAPLVVEFLVLLLGLWWTRGYIDPPRLPLDRGFLTPYVAFSAVFFVSNLFIMAFQQGGTPLVRLIAGNYAEAGFYSIAFSAYLAGSATLWKLISGFGALFSSLHLQGRTRELAAWTSRLLTGLALAGVSATALLYTCADLVVARLLGESYRSVAGLLWPLGLAGILAGPATLTRVLTVSFNLGRASNIGAAAQLVGFGLLGWLLIPSHGSLGACWAVVGSSAVYSTYTTARVKKCLDFEVRPWLECVAWGILFSPLVWAWSAPGPVRLAAFLAIYVPALFVRGIVRVADARLVLGALRSRQG
jgi:O-antigen/teichoic acid export membrane protein